MIVWKVSKRLYDFKDYMKTSGTTITKTKPTTTPKTSYNQRKMSKIIMASTKNMRAILKIQKLLLKTKKQLEPPWVIRKVTFIQLASKGKKKNSTEKSIIIYGSDLAKKRLHDRLLQTFRSSRSVGHTPSMIWQFLWKIRSRTHMSLILSW